MNDFYGEIIADHSEYPDFARKLTDANICETLENSSCGDKITIYLKTDGDKIIDGGFEAIACAISSASADLLLGAIIGKTKSEAKELLTIFRKAVVGEANEQELARLGDAAALQTVAKMPARIKCAELAWKIIEKL